MADMSDRRDFLKGLAAVSIYGGVQMATSCTAAPSESSLPTTSSDPSLAAASTEALRPIGPVACGANNRSLVCIFLAGGADTFFASLYDAGDLAVVSNVGPLVQPTSQADVAAGRNLPQSLFAHDAQQRLWQTATATVGGTAEGWGGQIASQVESCDSSATIPAAVSALGSSVWQDTARGNYLRLSPNSTLRRMSGFDPTTASWFKASQRDRLGACMEDILKAAENSDRELERRLAETTRSAIATNAELEDVTDDDSIDMGDYSQNPLKAQLHLVAQLIANRDRLGMTRQVFFVTMGGWDTHGDQNQRLPSLYAALNEAVGSFQTALGPGGLDVAESVTTFSITDFGRTLTSNGNGTDHGWGGHAFVTGGSVNGGRYFGEIPRFASANNPDDTATGRTFTGRIIPTTSVGQYGATLARWCGVDDSNLEVVFPDVANFETRDLGFMRA